MVLAIGATKQGSAPARPATEGTRMIHHVSIPAREPQHVAEVLAELMGGKCFPFGPLEGAFMAASGDAHGTMIEVYPERDRLLIEPIPARALLERILETAEEDRHQREPGQVETAQQREIGLVDVDRHPHHPGD